MRGYMGLPNPHPHREQTMSSTNKVLYTAKNTFVREFYVFIFYPYSFFFGDDSIAKFVFVSLSPHALAIPRSHSNIFWN